MRIIIDNEEWAGCVQETVDFLFRKVLKRKKPKTVCIVAGEPDDDSFSGRIILGMSNEKEFRIKLNHRIIWKKQEYENLFRGVLLHELMHEADLNILLKNDFYRSVIKVYSGKFPFKRLKWLLWMLDHCRAEGIAELGNRLLGSEEVLPLNSRMDFQEVRYRAQKDARFNMETDAESFAQLMERVIAAGEELPKDLFEEMRNGGYRYGCSVMLRVLRNLKLISESDEQRICTYIHTKGRRKLEQAGELSLFPEKKFKLSRKEIGRVLNACLSVNLPMYLEGLMLDREGKPVVSVMQLLTLCGEVQGYRQDDRIALFAKLVNTPQRTAADFNKAMRVLAGRPIKEESLARHIYEFQEGDPGWHTYFGFVDKINRLYALYQEHTVAGRKDLAQVANHALHYFFRVKDMIADYIPAFGFVDDLIVVDMALEILGAVTFLPQEKHLIKPNIVKQ